VRRAGIVVCGGLSSRMGRPKAWLPWFGQTMIEHVVGKLASWMDEVVVVTSAELDLPVLPARVVRDREPERGPLGGIRDGLAAIESPLAFVTSTDAPFLSALHVDALFDSGGACAPVAEGHVQVLSAVYPRTATEQADALLARGEARPRALLKALDFEAFDARGGDHQEGGFAPWHGFNTPEAYLDTVRAVDPGATAEIELLGRAALHVEATRRAVPVGTLGEGLRALPKELGLVEKGRVARAHLVSLGGRELVRDLGVPIGPGEQISVLDALAGG